MQQPDLTVRPLTRREELDLFRSIPYVLNRELDGDLDAGRRRLDWLWVALRGDRLVGRVGWWTRSADNPPLVLDFFDTSDVDDGAALVRTAMAAVVPDGATPPDHIRFLPPDWHDDPEVVRAVDDRRSVLEGLGARPLVERLRVQWDLGRPVPPPSDRLRFRSVADREELVGLMTQVLEGTLDAHSRRDLIRMTPADRRTSSSTTSSPATPRHASGGGSRRCPTAHRSGSSSRRATRTTRSSRTSASSGLPWQGLRRRRARGGTRILAAEGVPRIRAATDVGNVPMARCFARAGYTTFERQLDMTWS